MRIRIGRGFWSSRPGLALLGFGFFLLLVGAGIFTYYYITYARMIEERLSGHAFRNTARIYTAPARVFVGQALAPNDLASYLQRAGYTETLVDGAAGRYAVAGSTVEIRPAANSYFGGANGLRVEFAGREVTRIRSLANGAVVASAEVEP